MFNKFIRRTFSKQDKSLKQVSDILKDYFPLKLNKKDIMMQDQNLECFIPFDKIINQVKLVSLSKNFLDNLITNKSIEQYCEDNMADKIYLGMDQLTQFNKNNESGLKISLAYNIDLRKAQFIVNLYNIKNIVLLGIDPDRKKKKNLKMINYYTDMVINNSVSKQQIRSDIAINRERNNLINHMNDINIYLISQFEYSLISKKKDSFKLLVNVEDEFEEKKETMEFFLNSINFILIFIIS